MQRHGKRLHAPINLGPPQAKKVRLDRGKEDPTPKVPASSTTCPDGDGESASALAPLDAAGPRTAVMVQDDGPGRSSPAMVGTPMPKEVAEVPTGEKAPVERNSYTAAAPPSWEELMVMLKGVPCFIDAEARHPLSIFESVAPPARHLQEWTMPEAAKMVNTSLLFFSCFF